MWHEADQGGSKEHSCRMGREMKAEKQVRQRKGTGVVLAEGVGLNLYHVAKNVDPHWTMGYCTSFETPDVYS